MEFEGNEVYDFLQASMPVRFADITPYDFEDFIAALFAADGYTVEPTAYSGDFGADLLLFREGERTVVQVKRYSAQTPVGVPDLNQVIGAQKYYDADAALVITTSSYTASAVQLAKSTGLLLWDWERLERYIAEVYFDGQDYYGYFADVLETGTEESDAFQLHFHKLDLEENWQDNPAIAARFGLENNSGANVYVLVELPIVVNKAGRQVSAAAWKEGYFREGLLISGATSELCCYFTRDQLTEIRPGDRVVVRMHVRSRKAPVIIDQVVGVPKSGCYIVTYCYGAGSIQYQDMISLRDRLNGNLLGSAVVRQYYRASPSVVRYLVSDGRGALVIHLLLRRSIVILLLLWRSIRDGNVLRRIARDNGFDTKDARLLNNIDRLQTGAGG